MRNWGCLIRVDGVGAMNNECLAARDRVWGVREEATPRHHHHSLNTGRRIEDYPRSVFFGFGSVLVTVPMLWVMSKYVDYSTPHGGLFGSVSRPPVVSGDHLGLSGVMDHCIRHWQQPAPVRRIIGGFSLKTASKQEDGNFSDNFAEDSGKTWCRQHFLELNLRRNLVIFLASKIVDLGLWTMHLLFYNKTQQIS